MLATTELASLPLGSHGTDDTYQPASVRAIVLHLIEETATHSGHMEIARELLDGKTRLACANRADRAGGCRRRCPASDLDRLATDGGAPSPTMSNAPAFEGPAGGSSYGAIRPCGRARAMLAYRARSTFPRGFPCRRASRSRCAD
jgi:hypothetical protein